MTRIAVKHGMTKLLNFAIFHFFLTTFLYVSSLNEVASCESVKLKVGDSVFNCTYGSGCLFFDQQTQSEASSILPNAFEIAGSRSNGILDRIGARITCGIVESRKALQSMACFGDAIIDLPALITTNVDQQFTTDDVYWEYYAHCDRWQVTFNERLITPRDTYWMQDVIQRCRQTYLQLEFAAIESLPNGKLVTSNGRSQPTCSDQAIQPQDLSSRLLKFADQRIVDYWISLNTVRSNNSQKGILRLGLNQLLKQLKTTGVPAFPVEISSH